MNWGDAPCETAATCSKAARALPIDRKQTQATKRNAHAQQTTACKLLQVADFLQQRLQLRPAGRYPELLEDVAFTCEEATGLGMPGPYEAVPT